MRSQSASLTALVTIATLLLHGACAPPEEPELPPPGEALGLLSVSDDLRIVDDRDREVLLRGANITSLGEYWQGNPDLPPTVALTEQDWDDMEARGFSVIRLVVHWSRIEPERGQIDAAYLDEIEATVAAAADHGIYTVIDMHQDAYSAYIFTSEDEECPPDSWPGKGWDGAPGWACITDGASTCVVGDRNSAPAVVVAWNHFYDNTDGIRDRFVASWTAVAERFADHPEVAGYDLLNEADTSRPAEELAPIYNALLGELVTAIRAVGADQLIFIEPAIPAGHRDHGLVFPNPEAMGVEAHNLVGSTHNYAESIDTTGLSLEATNDFIWAMAENHGTGVWIGEYGFWGTSPQTLDKAARYGADEDAHVQGGAWWQWRQPCGDPHSLHRVVGGWEPGDTIVHLNSMDCVEGVDLGPTEEFFSILSRAYPRAAPGRITHLQSDPVTGAMQLNAVASQAGETLEVWMPTRADSHRASGAGLVEIVERELGWGRLLTATVPDPGPYSLSVEPI